MIVKNYRHFLHIDRRFNRRILFLYPVFGLRPQPVFQRIMLISLELLWTARKQLAATSPVQTTSEARQSSRVLDLYVYQGFPDCNFYIRLVGHGSP